jgi:hypothetical protein
MSSHYQPVVATSREGDFVLQSQPLAERLGFRNVSQTWYDKTLPYEAGFEALAAGQAQRDDLAASFADLRPTVGDGGFCLEHPSGRQFYPEEFALKQLAQLLDIPVAYPVGLYRRNEESDADALAYTFRHGLRRQPAECRVMLVALDDGTLRAVLPGEYEVIPNDWFLRVVAGRIPGGRLSHWRGNAETLWGNVLIPDRIRAEHDSEYGAMLSISNSEIGERPLSLQPSLFRAICMNGCIWGQTKGQKLVVRSRRIDLGELSQQIVKNIEEQTPLAVAGLDRLLASRTLTTDIAIKPVLAQVKKQFHLSKPEATAVLNAWHVEAREAPEHRHSLFAVINSITRAGQLLSNDDWVRFDLLGGELAALSDAQWQTLVGLASKLKLKEVENSFAMAG